MFNNAKVAAVIRATQSATMRQHADGAFWRLGALSFASMSGSSDSKPPSSGRALQDRLDSWKEIAAFLDRGIRTVQRWEREEGLPVHRLAHDKRGSVYARRDELAAWWESRRVTLAGQPSDEGPAEARSSRRLERITRTTSMTSWPALSSDARLIAYVSDGGQDG